MEDFGPFAVAIAFWVFLGACAIAGIIADYKKRQAALEPIRAAVERGQPIDAAVVERLMQPEIQGRGLQAVHLRIAGIITVATGVGVALLAFFIAQVAPRGLYPIFGGGVVAVCIGVGLLLAARAVDAQARRDGTHGN